MAHKVRIAIIGVGAMGFNHARILSKMKGCRLVAVVDINASRVRKVARQLHTRPYPFAWKLFKEARPEAVTIAAPTPLHSTLGLQALRHGCDVLIEKPLAETEREAKALIAAAKHWRRILMVGHVERFNPSVQRLREIIRRGSLGRIITVSSRRVGIFPPNVKTANVILDLAIHDLDILQYLLHEPIISAHADAGRVHANDRPDHAEILVRTRSATGLLQVNWITPVKIRTLTVTGTRGYAELDYLRQSLSLARLRHGRSFQTFSEFVRRFGSSPVTRVPIARAEPLERELLAFIRAIQTRRPAPVTGEDGLLAIRAARLVLRSL